MIIYGNMYLQGVFSPKISIVLASIYVIPQSHESFNSFSATPLLMILVNWNPSQRRLRWLSVDNDHYDAENIGIPDKDDEMPTFEQVL